MAFRLPSVSWTNPANTLPQSGQPSPGLRLPAPSPAPNMSGAVSNPIPQPTMNPRLPLPTAVQLGMGGASTGSQGMPMTPDIMQRRQQIAAALGGMGAPFMGQGVSRTVR